MTHAPSAAARNAALRAAYGFGLFPLPRYRDARVGEWRVVGHRPALATGYLPGRAVEARHVLYHRRTPWMSNGLLEQESHLHHVHQARGLVVVAGLGMGMYAFAAASRPEVARVVVIEREPDVIALMRHATGFEDWPDRAKLTIVEADALAPDLSARVAAVTGEQTPDYLYADIWPSFPDPEAPAQTAALVRTLRPGAAGWWGQEIAFGLWCRERATVPDAAALRAYADAVNVPIPASPGYAAFCRDALSAQSPERPAWGGLWRRWLGKRHPDVRAGER